MPSPAHETHAPRDVPRDIRFSPVLSGPAGSALVRRGLSVAILLLIDITAVTLGLFTALAGKLVLQGDAVDMGAVWATERKALPVAALTLLLVFAKNRLYGPRDQRGGAARVLSSTALATVVVAVVVLAAGWRFETYYIFYSSWFFISLFVLALRASYDSVTGFLLDAVGFERRALLVGGAQRAGEVARSLEAPTTARRVPYRVVARHALTSGTDARDPFGPGLALRNALDPRRIDEVILVEPGDGEDAAVLELLEVCRRRGIPVRLAPTTTELLSHSIHAVAAPGLPLFELRPPVLTTWSYVAKRAFDLVMASLLLLILSPLLLAGALAVKLEDRGPILHRSRRVGLNETEFTCIKLRTMHAGADAAQGELEERNEAGGALFKIRADPRVTRVGRVLRRLSLDELPQLVNVLRGEMSLVGPRPLPLRDYELLSDMHKKRYLVLPGLTGLWQVSGRSDLSFDDLIRLDFFYIESWSIWLDLTIIARTVPVVLMRKGAF
jgi:exopolysaccharide biosynthesis polyprenyl glycosylphosphotransferase